MFIKLFQVLDNTINKVAEEVLSAEELQERQVKIQVSNVGNYMQPSQNVSAACNFAT